MLEPLQKLVRLSPPIAASLAVPEIFTRTVQKLGHKDAVTRLNLLRILRTICDARDEECTLIKHFGVYDTIKSLAQYDNAVLVRQMAEELVRECERLDNITRSASSNVGSSHSQRSVSRASGFNRRPVSRSSAGPSISNRAGSGSSTGSTGLTPPTPTSLKSKFALPMLSPIPSASVSMSSSSAREPRERMGRSQSAVGVWDVLDNTTSRDSPKLKPAPLSRAATSFAMSAASKRDELGSMGSARTASSRPPSARPPSRDAYAARPQSRDAYSTRPPSRDAAGSLARLDSANGNSGGKSRLPKARTGRLSEVGLASRSRRERESFGGSGVAGTGIGVGEENATPAAPLPRLQIARRRRETSGGELGRRGS